VQLDGHRLDGIITVEVIDADGTERSLPLERIWLLVIIDEASRAILGYHLSLASNYSSDDVLDCVANALIPWSPQQTPSSRIAYRPGAGLPSGLITQCAWRAFDSLAFDNAMAHTSTWLQERVIRTVGCSINTGRPARALSRAIVERFFRTFEEDSLHRWPSTTGSTPDDPRRHKPEEAAAALKITLEDLELITDMTIANYNVSAHKSLNGRSPLGYIRYYDDNLLTLPRHIRESLCECLPLYDREFVRNIAGNARAGRRPYVTFMGANYRNEALATMIDYIGQKITLIVNVRDIRRVHGFLEDGTSIGTLNADEPWLRQPHSLRTRRAILKLIRAEELPRETYNPVGDHLEYLKKRARLNRRDRNRLLKQAREASQLITQNADPTDLPKRPAHPHVVRRHHISVSAVHTK
jgi:transposase InsO family protein